MTPICFQVEHRQKIDTETVVDDGLFQTFDAGVARMKLCMATGANSAEMQPIYIVRGRLVGVNEVAPDERGGW